MSNQTDETVLAAAPTDLPMLLIGAWKGSDADAIADLFVEDGTMTLPRTFCHGRAEIREYFSDAFRTHYQGSQVEGSPIGMHTLGPDHLVLLTKGGVRFASGAGPEVFEPVNASWVVRRTDSDGWKLVAYQNSPA